MSVNDQDECMWCLEPIAVGEYRTCYGIDLDTTVAAHMECHAICGAPERPDWRTA